MEEMVEEAETNSFFSKMNQFRDLRNFESSLVGLCGTGNIPH